MKALRSHWAVVAMVVVFVCAAFAFRLPAGVFLIIGLVGWLLEKPTQRLADRLGAYAERLDAEAEREAGERAPPTV